MATNKFKKSIVWNKSYQLTLNVYKMTIVFPKEEKYGLVSQMRRSSRSVVANISEGLLCGTRKNLANFMTMARASAGELETDLMLSHDLGYLDKANYADLLDKVSEIIKILNSSIKTPYTAN